MENLQNTRCNSCQQCRGYGEDLTTLADLSDDECEALYLEWRNDYLTLARMAEHGDLCENQLHYFVNKGREIFRERASV